MTDSIMAIEDKIKGIETTLENSEEYALLDENTKKELYENLNYLIDSLNKSLGLVDKQLKGNE